MADKDLIDVTEPEADGASPPQTPEGYTDPYRFEYPKLLLFVSASVLMIGSVIVYGWLLLQLQGPEILPVVFETGAEEEITIIFTPGETAGPFLFGFLTVAIVHELLHGVVYQRYGYEVSYGVYWRMGAVYAVVFHQFQSRKDNLRVGIAPLVVITGICLPLLAVPHPVIATTAFFVLTLNTAGAVGDIYALWRLYRMPSGTLLYDATIQHMYVFEPE
ncbi:DUF3267 domain-containing protein [Halostagnicola larsenii]|nr:DUF3267 domain-containing protein [Halostagnicola larsenii]